jgi:hypothetical protein
MATYSYNGYRKYPQNQDNGYRKYPTSQESQVSSNKQGQTTKNRSVSQDLKYRRFLRATYMNLLTGSNSFVFELLDHFGISLDLITAIRNVNSQTATQKDYNMIRSMGLNPEELNINDLVLNITMNHYLTAEEATNLLALVKNVVERKQ